MGVLTLVALAVAAVWVVRNRDRDRLIRQAVKLAPNSLLHAQNFHWTQMKGVQKQWELRASDARYSDDRSTLELIGSEFSMLMDDGKQVQLRAPKAELKLVGDHVNSAQLTGGLELDYGQVILTTSAATYLPDKDQLAAPGPVEIRGDGITVSGVGLEAQPHRRQFQLMRQVSTHLIPKPQNAVARNS